MGTIATTPVLRALRAALLAAVAVALGVVGHAIVAGDVPAPGVLSAIWATMAVALWSVAAWELRGRSILAVLAGGQALVHGAGILTVAHHAGAGHHADAVSFACALDPSAGTGRNAWAVGAMLAAHVLGTVGAAWWLRRGEALAWSLTRRIAHVVARIASLLVARPASPAEPRAASRVGAATTPLCCARFARSRPRRGPPLPARA